LANTTTTIIITTTTIIIIIIIIIVYYYYYLYDIIYSNRLYINCENVSLMTTAGSLALHVIYTFDQSGKLDVNLAGVPVLLWTLR